METETHSSGMDGAASRDSSKKRTLSLKDAVRAALLRVERGRRVDYLGIARQLYKKIDDRGREEAAIAGIAARLARGSHFNGKKGEGDRDQAALPFGLPFSVRLSSPENGRSYICPTLGLKRAECYRARDIRKAQIVADQVVANGFDQAIAVSEPYWRINQDWTLGQCLSAAGAMS